MRHCRGHAFAAPSANNARSFVERIIDFETTGDPDLRSKAFLSLLTPSFRAAVQSDMAGEYIGVLDYDPVCQCQDRDGLTMRIISLRQMGANAVATIENNVVNSSTVVLHLKRTAEGWRLADVGTPDQPSLLGQLERANRR